MCSGLHGTTGGAQLKRSRLLAAKPTCSRLHNSISTLYTGGLPAHERHILAYIVLRLFSALLPGTSLHIASSILSYTGGLPAHERHFLAYIVLRLFSALLPGASLHIASSILSYGLLKCSMINVQHERRGTKENFIIKQSGLETQGCHFPRDL